MTFPSGLLQGGTQPGGNWTAQLPLAVSSLSYGTRTVPFNSPVFVKSTAALEELNNTGFNFPVD